VNECRIRFDVVSFVTVPLRAIARSGLDVISVTRSKCPKKEKQTEAYHHQHWSAKSNRLQPVNASTLSKCHASANHTEENAVKSFFTPASQKAPEKTRWTTAHNTLLIAHYATSPDVEQERRRHKRRKIAAFDMVLFPNDRSKIVPQAETPN